MIDGTPDLESVRDAWALTYPDHEYGEAVEKFDRWLQSVKAEVWAKAYSEGFGDGGNRFWIERNPYLEK